MKTLITVLAIILVLFLLFGRVGREDYHSILNDGRGSSDGINQYYNWRAYGHNPRDYCRLRKFPYNYQPYEHPARFDYYLPNFYKYGYGNL